jgi:Zn-dependent M28 family amino/carboxypeptidase
MHRRLSARAAFRHPAAWAILLLPGAIFTPLAGAKDFSGAEAYRFTQEAVALGPRPSGSAANVKLRALIRQQLALRGCTIATDAFTAETPDGPIAMENIIAKFPGQSGRAVAVTGHFDTLKMKGFVGANDGGSSTGMLLELAAALAGRPHADDIYLVFFDGEEAVRQWSASDSTYGSRHLAERWTKDGTARRLKGLINVDMTGDRDLRLMWDESSAASLRKLVWDAADALGYSSAFARSGGSVEDDHLPFLNAGVRAVDLIDFDSQNTFWHTTRDTMDKLDPRSFDIIGAVVMRSIAELEHEK